MLHCKRRLMWNISKNMTYTPYFFSPHPPHPPPTECRAPPHLCRVATEGGRHALDGLCPRRCGLDRREPAKVQRVRHQDDVLLPRMLNARRCALHAYPGPARGSRARACLTQAGSLLSARARRRTAWTCTGITRKTRSTSTGSPTGHLRLGSGRRAGLQSRGRSQPSAPAPPRLPLLRGRLVRGRRQARRPVGTQRPARCVVEEMTPSVGPRRTKGKAMIRMALFAREANFLPYVCIAIGPRLWGDVGLRVQSCPKVGLWRIL